MANSVPLVRPFNLPVARAKASLKNHDLQIISCLNLPCPHAPAAEEQASCARAPGQHLGRSCVPVQVSGEQAGVSAGKEQLEEGED